MMASECPYLEKGCGVCQATQVPALVNTAVIGCATRYYIDCKDYQRKRADDWRDLAVEFREHSESFLGPMCHGSICASCQRQNECTAATQKAAARLIELIDQLDAAKEAEGE